MTLSLEKHWCPFLWTVKIIHASSHLAGTTRLSFPFCVPSTRCTPLSPLSISTAILVSCCRTLQSRWNFHSPFFIDTWKPSVFGGAPSEQAAINHGTYFYWANQEGLIRNGTSIASVFVSLSSNFSPYVFLFIPRGCDPSLFFSIARGDPHYVERARRLRQRQ